jgi:hypothetical protein
MKWFRLKKIRIFPLDPEQRRKINVFIACLFFSAVFWLVIKLSQPGTGAFTQPVAVIEVPQGYFMASKSHSFIRYSVITTGARMLTSRFIMPTDTFYVRAAGLPSMMRNGSLVHYLTSSSISFRVSTRLRPDIDLMNVWPDTIFFNLVPAMEKRVRVQLRANVGFERRFNQYGPLTVEPDSVIIRGPIELIDTLSFIHTRRLNVENLDQTREFEVELRRPDGLLNAQLSHERVRVTVPVEEFTEATINVPLRIRCPENIRSDLVLFPPRVNITYLIALRDYGRADSSDFSAHVNCPAIDPLPSRLEVNVDMLPPYAVFQNVRPSSVEYLIVK